MPPAHQFTRTAVTHGLSSSDALTALLTVETLLFAAFAVAAVFLTRREEGWDLPTSAASFGWFVAGSICVVAVGACASWVDVYITHGLNLAQCVSGFCLLAGILAIASMSLWVAKAIKENG